MKSSRRHASEHHRQSRSHRRGYALLDAVLGGLLLAVALAAVLSLAARSLQMERRGEQEIIAAALLDGILSMVVVEGPAEYPKRHDMSGRCDAPFDAWEYEVTIESQGLGDPWRVLALVRDPSGATHRCGTLVAPRLDDVTVPVRRPPQRMEREERYEQIRQAGR